MDWLRSKIGRVVSITELRIADVQFPWGACVSAIIADPDDPSRLTGLGDPRKDGAPAVY